MHKISMVSEIKSIEFVFFKEKETKAKSFFNNTKSKKFTNSLNFEWDKMELS